MLNSDSSPLSIIKRLRGLVIETFEILRNFSRLCPASVFELSMNRRGTTDISWCLPGSTLYSIGIFQRLGCASCGTPCPLIIIPRFTDGRVRLLQCLLTFVLTAVMGRWSTRLVCYTPGVGNLVLRVGSHKKFLTTCVTAPLVVGVGNPPGLEICIGTSHLVLELPFSVHGFIRAVPPLVDPHIKVPLLNPN